MLQTYQVDDAEARRRQAATSVNVTRYRRPEYATASAEPALHTTAHVGAISAAAVAGVARSYLEFWTHMALASAFARPTGKYAITRELYDAIVHQPVDRFSEFKAYDVPDWDGYGAEPISAETITAARSLFHALPVEALSPDIAPAADGTIGFEWVVGDEGDRRLVFVDVGPNERFSARILGGDGALIG